MSKDSTTNDDQPSSVNSWVRVSSGTTFRLVRREHFRKAKAAGYYCPSESGKAVVLKDHDLFEVERKNLDAALANGAREILCEFDDRNEAIATKPDGPMNVLVEIVPNHASEEQRREREIAISKVTGWRLHLTRIRIWMEDRRAAWTRRFGSGGISVIVHVAIILLLSSFMLPSKEKEKSILTVSVTEVSAEIAEPIAIETVPLELTEPTESEPDDPAPAEDVEMEPMELADSPDILGAVSGDAIKPPKSLASAADGDGDSESMGPAKPTLFGSEFTATNFVFVIDNSNSMKEGRFETALLDLVATVNQLTPKQRFYVIFYSDTAYLMMHPNPVPAMVNATPKHKAILRQWLDTVQLCLRTNGKQALKTAFELNPDVVYVLGDGAFTDDASSSFAASPVPGVVVHTRGMEVNKREVKSFRELAESHGGTYEDVGVTPEGLAMSKRYPRKQNRSRGPVWGLTLPQKK